MKIRYANQADLPAITRLFRETVKTVNAPDYTLEQINVWADCAFNKDAWEKSMKSQMFFVAEINEEIVGFTSIAEDGYLDYLYVHKDHQREGIAYALLQHVEQQEIDQGNQEIYAYVSKTATPFFVKKGYRFSGHRINSLKGIRFNNNIMRKALPRG